MNREKTPCVSVIMAVYNGETYLLETVSSILNQTFRDFEYIIVDDGSTDDTEDILATFTDSRIVVLCNDQNKGLPYSLNRGLAFAQGKYIARIDVGDLAMPERLEKQVAFLEEYSEIGILGSGCLVIDDTGKKKRIVHFPLGDLEIRWTSLLKNPFLHPSVMIRRDVLRQNQLNYDTTFQAAQDYELWTRMLEYTHGANLEELLTIYRISNASITVERRTEQLKNHDAVALRTIRQQLPEFAISPKQVSQLRESFIGGEIRSRPERKVQCAVFASLYLDLLTAFAQKYYSHPEMKELRQHETVRIALMAFRVPLFSHWLKTLKRAVRLYPGVVYPLTRYILKKHVWKRLRRFIQRHYNKLRKERIEG